MSRIKLVNQCYGCNAVKTTKGEWRKFPFRIKKLNVTHGLCKPCFEKYMRELEREDGKIRTV